LLLALIVVAIYTFGGGQPTSQDVVAEFKAQGVDVADSYPIEQEGQSPMPKTYKEGTRFTIASMGKDTNGEAKGGRVFTFDSQSDMKPVQDYFEGLGKPSGLLSSYVYTKDNILVQINGELSKDKAEEYNRVLQGM
jgi:hypothetical protein